jgi:hypothetical protein
MLTEMRLWGGVATYLLLPSLLIRDLPVVDVSFGGNKLRLVRTPDGPHAVIAVAYQVEELMGNDERLNSPPVHLPVAYVPVGVELLMLIIMVVEGVRSQLLLVILLHGHPRLAVAFQMRLAVLVPLFEDHRTHGLI